MRALIVALLLASPLHAQTKIFRDDFAGTSGPVNAAVWQGEGHAQGSGQFTGAGEKNGNGKAVLAVTNPHPDDAETFAQQVMRTKRTFLPQPGETLIFRTRLAMPHDQSGLVHSIFLYSSFMDGSTLRSNEIDFEWMTNQTAGSTKDKVLLTTWVDWNNNADTYNVVGSPLYGTHAALNPPNRGDAGEFAVYEIEWSLKRVAWYKVSPKGKRQLLGERKGRAYAPQRPMHLYFNTWVPGPGWVEAFDPSLVPSVGQAPVRWRMVVDWVEVLRRKDKQG
ncbi:glycoside hydrolase family 16 protein [Neogemmobacter tilapiae]|uniref:GH16 domain-containing protein n=1 Tax=Neogemmobacter tilapiae TaxID=875041 RepID=A0A918WIK4_9RHOB|nr:glycoside hydrolase family 16 protein [Gemmobacter tilapiae]GHC54842.1 hypothetical protein GCM10007315_17320 [Gemmobacter tilapiae]